MKKIRFLIILILTLAYAGLFNACNSEDDYSNIVYKNYLSYEIKSAEALLAITEEGFQEGEYQSKLNLCHTRSRAQPLPQIKYITGAGSQPDS